MSFDELLSLPVYGLDKNEKADIFSERLWELTMLHQKRCVSYARILKGIGFTNDDCGSIDQLPYLPVRLFKHMQLLSVDEDSVYKIMTSSGTSGQAVSRIFLDRKTAVYQQKVMAKIVGDFLGSTRMPMLIIDSPNVLQNRAMFSARGAGVLGFSIFGSKRQYALDGDMHLNVDDLLSFLEMHVNERIFLFGFTFMVWQHFYKELKRLREQGLKLDLSNCVLIHGGGWKSLERESVSPDEFRNRLNYVCGLNSIHSYYGMVEQTGSICMECEYGHLHTSLFSELIIRRAVDSSICQIGEPGIIQAMSVIPESYPGHNILTEDLGVLLGEDDCPCGRKGKYFSVQGRIARAELRGCSDTYAASFN